MPKNLLQENIKKYSSPGKITKHEFQSIREMTLMENLLELRSILLKIILVVTVVFLCLFPFANEIYTIVAQPLTNTLPGGTTMIATSVASPFLAPLKLSILLAIYLTVPFSLYQIWKFVAPGLYQNEKRLVAPIILSSTILFYLGAVFAYFVVFPIMFEFFNSTVPEGVKVTTDITMYLNFVVKLFFSFGIAFEVPIITLLLVINGTITLKQLKKIRPYIIIGCFVLGMFLTPPDIISQTLLAAPMWILFEISLIVAGLIQKNTND